MLFLSGTKMIEPVTPIDYVFFEWQRDEEVKRSHRFFGDKIIYVFKTDDESSFIHGLKPEELDHSLVEEWIDKF